MNEINSIKRKARIAGLLYLLLAITSIFGLVYVPSKIIVAGDTVATISNIIASPRMYRLGIMSNLIYLIVFVFLVLAFFDLFKEVNKKHAWLMVALVLVAIPIAFINELNKIAVLLLVEGDSYLKAFETSERNAWITLFLDLYRYEGFMVMSFWGLWLFPLGLLVLKSGFIPRALGYVLVVGCFGYLVTSFTFLLSPHYGKILFQYATLPSAIAEILLILWLLVKGAKEEGYQISRSR